MEGCAPSMGVNLWGASPLWENRIGLMRAILTTSRWQGLTREGGSGGSPSANVRGDGQKPHSQGRGSRGKLAHDGKAHRFDAYGKCGACAQTVRDPYLGRSAPRAVQMNDDMTRIGSTGIPRPSAVASCPLRVEETGSNVVHEHSATRRDAGRDGAEVSSGHSRCPGVGVLKVQTMRHKEQAC